MKKNDYKEMASKVDLAWNYRNLLKKTEVKELILKVITLLSQGAVRVATKTNGKWEVHERIKKAILLYFSISENKVTEIGNLIFKDKINTKRDYPENSRVVPNAVAREGVFIGSEVILMPSYVNIGAYVDSGSMVDIGAAIGSCAQIGKRVHVSASAVIGGVLEPVQSSPVIIEDNAFIGANSVIVEGVVIGEYAVVAASVTITSSTRIIDVTQEKPLEHKGYVPPYSIVIPGSFTKEFAAGRYNVNCALIIGKRTAKTDKKVALNEALRAFEQKRSK